MNLIERKITKQVNVGNVLIVNLSPITIQSMTNTKTEDVRSTVQQILELEQAGCEIIRCAVPTMEAAQSLKKIKEQIHIPLVADIHFDYKLAIASIEAGADKIRINPGNIGSKDRVAEVVRVAKERNIPIRVGVNSGSLEREIVEKYQGVTPDGMVESALKQVALIEEQGYSNLVISIKTSDVLTCVRAHEIITQKTSYPLHVGITEAGTLYRGNIKSAMGLSMILGQGIGDTIRVSLTGNPIEEIRTAKVILSTLGIRESGVEIVSCPTCGRTSATSTTRSGVRRGRAGSGKSTTRCSMPHRMCSWEAWARGRWTGKNERERKHASAEGSRPAAEVSLVAQEPGGSDPGVLGL